MVEIQLFEAELIDDPLFQGCWKNWVDRDLLHFGKTLTVPSQTLDRQILVTTNSRYDIHKA